MDPRSFVLLLVFCIFLLHDASDITPACARELSTRKTMMMKRESESGGANGEGEEKLNEELRIVPSGPDPLHHHVNPPKQPRNHSHLP